MAAFARKKCPCLRPKMEPEVRMLDYRHSSLRDVPSEVFNKERTLEELYADSNQIRDLPRELFYCHGLRKLCVSDNEITSIPPAISSLANLEELDFSKNGVIEVPENIKGCKYLRSIDASVNPLGKLPEGFIQLENLTHLYLNDTFLDFLPGSFGRMKGLRILEMRENHLKTLPNSFARLARLERLDIGNNEFTELSEVIGGLLNLLELWCDNNQITSVSQTIGNLKQLMFLDASKNQLQELPAQIEGCVALADLHLTSNHLLSLPESIGNLNNLTTLKADDNQLTSLPKTIGGLSSLSELNVSANDLEDLPVSIGLLRNLRTFYADENLLQSLPAEVGSCNGITVLSLRSNKLTYIPDEIGRIPRLRVLNLSDNLLQYLPYTIVKLKELQALWLTENQTRPLIPLQSEHEPDTGRKILTCYLLPQSDLQPNDEVDPTGDTSSFHASMWDEERLRRQQIHFDFADDSEEEGTLVRCPTPYPKEMRAKVRHARNLAMRQMVGGASRGETDTPTGVTSLSTPADGDGAAPVQPGGAEERLRVGGQPDSGEENVHNGYGYSTMADRSDIRIREARITSSTSPSSPSHRLYRADKDKQNKDKARMQQHRNSVPDFSDITGLINNQQSKSYRDDFDVNNPARRSGSVPDLSVTPDGGQGHGYRAAKEQGRAPTFDELYSKHMGFKHQPHRSHRRGRRSRGYDSDTGYKSDRDVLLRSQGSGGQDGTGSEILSVRSQPSLRRSNGYTSDIGPYSSAGVGTLFPTANAAAAAFQQNRTKPGSNNDLLFPQTPISTSTPHVNRAHPRAKTPTNSDYDFYNHHHHHQQQQQQQQQQEQHEGSMGSYQDLASHHHFPSNQDLASPYQHSEGSNHIAVSESYHNQHTPHPTSFSAINQQHPPHPSYPQQQRTLQPAASSSSLQGNSQPGPQSEGQQQNQQRQQQQLPQIRSSNGYGPPPPVAPKPKLNLRHGSVGQEQGYRDFSANALLNQSAPLDGVSQGQAGSRSNYSPRDTRRVVSRNQGQTNQVVQPRQTPPPYTPAPPYHRKSSEPMTNGPRPRLPSNASSGSGTGMAVGPSFYQHGLGSNPSLAGVERSLSSPCGFHGSNPYTDFPGTSSKGSDTGGCGRGRPLSRAEGVCDTRGDRAGNSIFQDNMTTHSGSSSSHIGSASQIGNLQHKKLTGSNSLYSNSNFRPRDRSDSSDSRSDSQTNSQHVHHHHHQPRHLNHQDHHFHDSSNNSYSDSSRQHHLSSSFDNGHNQSPAGYYEDFTHIMGSRVAEVTCNPEQSSQVSSSTDSGYGPGHSHRGHTASHNHVYESIGGFPGSGGSHALSSSAPHTPPSQRQTPTQGIGRPNSSYNHNINNTTINNNNNSAKSVPPLHLSSSTASNSSREATPIKDFTVTSVPAPGISPAQFKPNSNKCKEYREKFRVTIKKNPDLGFSIAGGIGQGNRYRANDIGIFVSKVIPDGPASKLLMTGDKLLEVNKVDFQAVEHHQAVQVLKTSTSVNLLVERIQKVNMV